MCSTRSASSSRVDAISWNSPTKRTKKSLSRHPDRQLVDEPAFGPGGPADPHSAPDRHPDPGRRDADHRADGERGLGADERVDADGEGRAGDRQGSAGGSAEGGSSGRSVVCHRTTTRCAPERNSECRSSRITSRPVAEPLPGAQVVLEQLHLVDPADALDRLQQLGDRRGVQVGVEEPAGAVGTTVERVDVPGQLVDRPLPDQRHRPAGRRMHQRRDRDALVVRSSHLDRGADDAVGIEVLGDPAHQRRGQREVVELRGCADRCAPRAPPATAPGHGRSPTAGNGPGRPRSTTPA